MPDKIQRIPGLWGTLIFNNVEIVPMKSYSIEFREKIVKAYFQGNTSIIKVAARFSVAKSFVQKLLSIHKCQGSLEPKKPGGAMKGALYGMEVQRLRQWLNDIQMQHY